MFDTFFFNHDHVPELSLVHYHRFTISVVINIMCTRLVMDIVTSCTNIVQYFYATDFLNYDFYYYNIICVLL